MALEQDLMKQTHLIQLCDALVHLMQPLLEIVIHDLGNESICYIKGNLSKRKAGDPSLLDKASLQSEELNQVTYPKLNFDGRLIKAISVPIDDQYLVCINCDISIFHKMQQLALTFTITDNNATAPNSLFKNDWQERLHTSIHNYLQQQSWHFDTLRPTQKKAIAHHLFQLGAFEEKKAADYIAETLSMGRATIFNYLKEWR